jgi:hypothetical protein
VFIIISERKRIAANPITLRHDGDDVLVFPLCINGHGGLSGFAPNLIHLLSYPPAQAEFETSTVELQKEVEKNAALEANLAAEAAALAAVRPWRLSLRSRDLTMPAM